MAAGLDVNAELPAAPETPLHLAVLKGCTQVVAWLLEHGANVNAGGGNYPTPLSYAASGTLDIVKLLVAHGADVNTCHDNPPRNPLLLAQERGARDIEDFLRDHGARLPSELTEHPRPDARGTVANALSDVGLATSVREEQVPLTDEKCCCMTASLASYIDELGLDEHRDYLLGIARPSVEIITVTAPITQGCSKLGGSPDLPVGFQWPSHQHGMYRFIGQVNLADVPGGRHGLPGSGLLSFFCAHDDDGESFWGAPDYVIALRFEEVHELQPVRPPTAVGRGATCAVKFQAGADVPPWPWDAAVVAKWPISKPQRDAYARLRRRLHPSGRYLMGYPLNSSLAYDPTPGPTWRSLLTLSSDGKLEWCWHDGDWLVAFIETHRLHAGDFSMIKADAG